MPPYVPSAVAQAAAVQAGLNEAALATPITSLRDSVAAGNLAPAAFIDAIIGLTTNPFGFQAEQNIILAPSSTSSTTFADVSGAEYTCNVTFPRTYTVHCDFSLFFSDGDDAPLSALVRLVVNGSAGPSMLVQSASTNMHVSRHLMHAAPLVGGDNLIKVQWAVVGTCTANVDGSDMANLIVTG